MLALGVPSSSFRRMVPAVAVYLISCPPIFRECLVCTIFSSGVGGFFSSFGFSAGFSGDGCGCCWAKPRFIPRRIRAAEPNERIRDFIGGGAPFQTLEKYKTVTCGIVCESRGSVNRFRLPATAHFPGGFSSCCR